ncbi:MAG: hypothetical protein LBO66_14045 [Deltaproteobacteria bacterium]|jgi:DNA-directed RNA polymerase specialized sigma24 family protein|nr:hypothetical protein [Deltaproteobacteria bacterium]
MPGGDLIDFVDMITDGHYSFLLKEREALTAEIKAKTAEKEALTAESEAKTAKKEALTAESEALRRTTAILAQRAVLALRDGNKSVEKISEILGLSLAEVGQILDSVGKEKKRLRLVPGTSSG